MKLSIIIPCFNVENLVEKTVNTVLCQDYKKIEVILINDGSIDNTLAVLNEIKNKNKSFDIFVINQENQGVSAARNNGIKRASGEFILFLDADDYLKANSISELFKYINANQSIDLLVFGYEIQHAKNFSSIISYKKFAKKNFNGVFFLNLFLTREIRQHISSIIFRNKFLTENNIYFDEDITNGEDQEFQIRAMFFSQDVFYLDNNLFTYNIREGSVTNIELSSNNLSILKSFIKVYSFLETKTDNKELLSNLSNYTLLQYFNLLRRISKANKEYLFEELQEYYSSIGINHKLKINAIFLKVFLLNKIYRISPKATYLLLKHL